MTADGADVDVGIGKSSRSNVKSCPSLCRGKMTMLFESRALSI